VNAEHVADELARLVRGFAEHMRRARRSGRRWLPAATTPRSAEVELEGDRTWFDREAGQPGLSLDQIREQWGACTRCRLHHKRTHLVFGVGHPHADLMFIGEAPGFDEDRQGEPFVGKAGQLLTRMIEAMGLTRQQVYIANIIKCRPPRNRNPEPDEVDSCLPVLRRQIEAIAPRMMIALGNFAAKTLLRTDRGITRLRGQFHDYQGVALMPTFHPAYLLRNPDAKRSVWSDLQQVMAEMDRLGLSRNR